MDGEWFNYHGFGSSRNQIAVQLLRMRFLNRDYATHGVSALLGYDYNSITA